MRLRVSDHGSGFPAHILQRAFEPYVTTKAKGTGLGLTMVKKIADEHGARVRIANLGVARDVATGDTPPPAGAAGATGAQVSLSFSKFAPADGPTAVAAATESRTH